MSVVKSNSLQLGQSLTATNNGTWYQPSTPDGTIRYGIGNAGATTSDVVTLSSSGLSATALIPSGSTAPTNGMFLPTTNTLAWSTNSTERLRLDSSGNLGLGVTPSAWRSGARAFQISTYGSLSQTPGGAVQLGCNFYTDSAGTDRYLNTDVASKYQSSGAHYWYTAPSGTAGNAISFTQAMTLDASGYLLVGYTSSNGAYKLQVNSQIFATSAIIATSDANYKTNVKPISSGLSLINALNPVQFNWKAHEVHAFDVEQPTVGFLAQEVEAVLKDTEYVGSIVYKNECELLDGSKEEFLGLADGKMIPLLVAAIKELSAELNELKAKVNA